MSPLVQAAARLQILRLKKQTVSFDRGKMGRFGYLPFNGERFVREAEGLELTRRRRSARKTLSGEINHRHTACGAARHQYRAAVRRPAARTVPRRCGVEQAGHAHIGAPQHLQKIIARAPLESQQR